MEKEQFINDILNCTNGITKVEPSDELFSKIEQRVQEKSVVPMKTLWLVAASIVVLMSLNIILLSEKSSSKQSELASIEQSINKSNQLYK
jgi:cell division protein FtsL